MHDARSRWEWPTQAEVDMEADKRKRKGGWQARRQVVGMPEHKGPLTRDPLQQSQNKERGGEKRPRTPAAQMGEVRPLEHTDAAVSNFNGKHVVDLPAPREAGTSGVLQQAGRKRWHNGHARYCQWSETSRHVARGQRANRARPQIAEHSGWGKGAQLAPKVVRFGGPGRELKTDTQVDKVALDTTWQAQTFPDACLRRSAYTGNRRAPAQRSTWARK